MHKSQQIGKEWYILVSGEYRTYIVHHNWVAWNICKSWS